MEAQWRSEFDSAQTARFEAERAGKRWVVKEFRAFILARQPLPSLQFRRSIHMSLQTKYLLDDRGAAAACVS